MRKAAPYIRAHTRPLLILIESYLDFCKNASDTCLKNFPVIYQLGKGYNFYIAGCFYPEDADAIRMESLVSAFNKDHFQLFFGGRFKQQTIASNMPNQYLGMKDIQPKYNKFLLRYQDTYNELTMPCGQLLSSVSDPDEDRII